MVSCVAAVGANVLGIWEEWGSLALPEFLFLLPVRMRDSGD